MGGDAAPCPELVEGLRRPRPRPSGRQALACTKQRCDRICGTREAKEHERIPPLNAAGPAQRASPTLPSTQLQFYDAVECRVATD